MVNVKDVFKKISVPRPQISTRVAYSTTPKQRRNYLEDISKARGKAMEYNKYINQQRSEYIKNQEEFQRRLSNIKKATQQYESSRADISREVESLRRYEASLQAQQDRLAAQKRASSRSSSRSRGTSYMRWSSTKPSPISKVFSSGAKVSKAPKPVFGKSTVFDSLFK